MISPINDCHAIGCNYSFQAGRPTGPGNDENEPFTVGDSVSISLQGRELLKVEKGNKANTPGEEGLTEDNKKEVERLKKRDKEVKAHERAHMAAGAGVVVGGASYEYEVGPDGKMYAVGGEVKIDTTREKDPEATIRKMQQVKRAALAPAQPSGTDRQVAAQAAQIEAQARIELSEEKRKETEEGQDPAFQEHLMTISKGPYDFKTAGNTINILI
jgi:hypothetical protein